MTKKARQVKSTNILHIYDRLRQSPVTLDVLHDWAKNADIQVSRRTLYRYLEDLASSIVFKGEKLVIFENEYNKKVWKIEFDHSEDWLNQFDINSFYILRNFIPQSLSLPRESSLEKLDKLIYNLASKSQFQLNVDANKFAFIRTNSHDAKYSENDHCLLEETIWALQHHKKIRIEEFNWDTFLLPTGFQLGMLVLPLRLIFHTGLIYTGVYSEDLNKAFIIPFHQVTKQSVTKLSFIPTTYLPLLDDYLANTFGVLLNFDDEVYDIEIELAGFTGEYAKTMFWHSSQRFETLPSGNFILHLRCGINRELIGFIFNFQINARVLKPLKLQNLLKGWLIKMLENNTDIACEMTYRSSFKPDLVLGQNK